MIVLGLFACYRPQHSSSTGNEGRAISAPFCLPLGDEMLSNPGLGFAVPAGTMISVQIDGEQKVRVNSATSPGKDEK